MASHIFLEYGSSRGVLYFEPTQSLTEYIATGERERARHAAPTGAAQLWLCGRCNKHLAARSSSSIQRSLENLLVSRCSMGIDRRSWACQSKMASSSSDNEQTLVDASPSSPAARNPATPQDDRGYCRESSLGRKEFPGGIGAVGSDRRPWVNQASYLEVGSYCYFLYGHFQNCEVRQLQFGDNVCGNVRRFVGNKWTAG